MPQRLRRFLPALILFAPLFVSGPASAVGSRAFELLTLDDLTGGDLKGVAVGADGVVRAGLSLGHAPMEGAQAVFGAVELADHSVLVGTGPAGKIFRAVGDQVTLFADTTELAVTSLVQSPSGAIYAATIPSGRIYRVAQGKAEIFATLPNADYVWAIGLDKPKTGLFAATGPKGKLFHVPLAGGAPTVQFASEEPHLVTLAVDAQGIVYAGSSGKGLLFRVEGPGRAKALFDFPGEEVKGIALLKSGGFYAIANEYGEPPEPPRRGPATGRTPPGPTSSARPKPGKGSLYRFDAEGRPERLMHHDEFHYVSLALDEAETPYVGTGAEGRVYTVSDAHSVQLVADTDERQAAALAFGKTGYVVSGDPAVFHRITGRGGIEAVWTSKVLDAGLRARFGRLSWRSTGPIELSTRSGNTATPDGTWSPWSTPHTASGPVTSPPGRYVQVRGRFARDPTAQLAEVRIPFVTDNVRPVVLDVSAAQKGISRPGRELLPSSGGELPKHESVVRLTWKVDNPDNDALRYRLSYRREGQPWRELLRPDEFLTKAEYDWETLTLPEGKYRVRVEASDEAANPPGQALRHALESAPFLVDNTPPSLRDPVLRGRRLRVVIVDGVGPIARVEVAIDGKTNFHPLAPVDGIFDSAEETIDADLSTILPAGAHTLAIRAFDVAGNATLQELEVR